MSSSSYYSPNSSNSSPNPLFPSIYPKSSLSLETQTVPDNPICSEFTTSSIRSVDHETATMVNKATVDKSSQLEEEISKKQDYFHRLRRENHDESSLEFEKAFNDLFLTILRKNQNQNDTDSDQDTKVIVGTGVDSQLGTDTRIVKFGFENIGLIESEFIEPKLTKDEVDVNLKSISLDSADDLSSVRESIQNYSTFGTTDEGNFQSNFKYVFSVTNGSSAEVQEYMEQLKFLDYQEGKPFVSQHNSLNIVLDSQVRRVTNAEVKDFNLLHQNANAESQQFEDQKLITYDNLNQFTSYIFQILKVFSRLQIISSSDSVCMLFDCGKEFVVCEMYSYCARRNLKLCLETLSSCLIIPMEKYDEESYYELILQHGCQLDSKFMNSVVFVLVKDSDSYNGENLFARMYDRDCITSYACGRLLFDQCRIHQTKLWNSYLEVLVASSSELFHTLLNYMRSNDYELDYLNVNSYVIGVAEVLVKTSQGHNEDGDTLIVGRVFDRGRMLKSSWNSSKFCLNTLSSGVFFLMVSAWMNEYTGNFVYEQLNDSKMFTVTNNKFSSVKWVGCSLDLARTLFDRGKEFYVLISGYSVYELDLELGLCCDFLFKYMNMFCLLSGDCCDASKLNYEKSQQGSIVWTVLNRSTLQVTRVREYRNVPERFSQVLVKDDSRSTQMEEACKKFMGQEILSTNTTMLLVKMLNFVQLNLWIFLLDIELSLLWRPSHRLPIGNKLLNVSSMKTNSNTVEKGDLSKILVQNLGGNIGILSLNTVATTCDEFSTERPRSILPWVSFFLPSFLHTSTMNDNHNTRRKSMKETIIPGLFVFNTFEDTRRIFWLKRGYRGVERYARRKEIKGMLAKACAGEISGHEWLEEMLMGVGCSRTQLRVAVLKLTVILIIQICSLL